MSSSDLPVGFLAEVFAAGCQCDHCQKWREEVERLRRAIRQFDEAYDRDPLKYEEMLPSTSEAIEGLIAIAREGK